MKDKEEKPDYIQLFIDREITAEMWYRNRNIDFWQVIDQIDLPEEEIEEILWHQYYLFKEIAQKITDNKISNLINRNIDTKTKRGYILEYLRVIELFLNGSTDAGTLALLRIVTFITPNDAPEVLVAYQRISTNFGEDLKEDYQITKTSTYAHSPMLTAQALYNYKKELLKTLDTLEIEEVQKKSSKTIFLKKKLCEFGFFDLMKVKTLSQEKQNHLVVSITGTKKLPYAIAMFDHLGFIKHLQDQYFSVKYKLYQEVAKWYDSDKDGRTVRGNIHSLLKKTSEDKNRYTAYKYVEAVKKDYQQLK